jgi:hypothetical protein
LLNSNTLDVSSGTSGTLDVFVTATGNTSPTGLVNFLSSFTQNLLTQGWSVTEKSFHDSGNTAYATTTALGSFTFTASDETSLQTLAALTGSGPYSLTEEYIINANGQGNTNSTIDLTTVPLPGALPLFASGILGFWAWTRKRKPTGKLPGPSFA